MTEEQVIERIAKAIIAVGWPEFAYTSAVAAWGEMRAIAREDKAPHAYNTIYDPPAEFWRS